MFKIQRIDIYSSIYPNSLNEIYDPPKTLYIKGNLDLLKEYIKNVSIVGSRKVSDKGIQITKEFTKYISLYLALIVKKPLHPYGNDPKEDEVYMKNNSYYCKGRAKFIKDQKSLCRYCICKNPPFAFMF